MADTPRFVPSQPRAGLLRRLRRLMFGLVPLTVWLASIAGVLYLAQLQTRPLDYPGLALVTRYEVRSPKAGNLQDLLVVEQMLVQQGDVVGQLSGAGLEVRARQVGHAIEQLRAEIARERELRAAELELQQLEQENDYRRFSRDHENARLDLLEVEARVEESRIRLAGLQIDLERQRGLSSERLFSEAELIRTKTEYDALKENIARTEAVIKARKDKLAAVEARLEEYRKAQSIKGADPKKIEGPFHWRISVQQEELELIAMQRKDLVLRAPATGRVEIVHVRSGERVLDGEPVITIVDPRPRAIVAYLPAAAVHGIRPGMSAIMERSTQPGTTVHTKVLSVGPTVEELPESLWSNPNVREWRVPVHLQFNDDLAALPGEHLRVRILSDSIIGG